jgi:two-component system LytT family response regulator
VRLANPQLIILDVQMADMSVFDVVERLSSEADQSRPHVIFVADTDEYALRAFEVRAVDYLLKPFTRERLEDAVQRVRERLVKDEPDQDGTQKPEQQEFPSRLVLKSRGQILFLPVAEIRWIKAQENYVKIFTGHGSHLLRETISSVENGLDPRLFLRIHRSAIVHLLHVKEVRNETSGDATVVLKNGQKVPMSRKYRSILDTLIKAQ